MGDEIKFRCESCDRKLSVKASAAGRSIDCPACGKTIQIPAAGFQVQGADATTRIDTHLEVTTAEQDALRSELEEVRQDLISAQKDREEIQEERHELQKRLEALSSDINRYAVDLEKSLQKENDLNTRIGEQKDLLQKEQEIRKELEKEYAGLQKEMEALKTAQGEAKELREEQEKQADAFEAESRKWDEARRELETARDSALQRSRSLSEALDTLRHETEQANQDHEGHQQQLQEALKQIEELKKEVDDKQQNDAEIQKLNERLQEVERERDELLQKHEQAVNEAILVRKDLEQSLASAVRPEEFANLREENTQLKAQLESASVSGHAHAENQEVLQDIDELKARRDALGKEIAQAKATISDAATIMGKNKSLQDKVDALTRENQLLRESDGSSNTAAAAAEPTPAAPQAPNPEPVKPVAAKKPTFKPVDASITNHRAGRSFGRGVPSPAAESRHMSGKVPGKKPQDSAKSLMPKGDNRNKFAKSLFGNVNDKNSKK